MSVDFTSSLSLATLNGYAMSTVRRRWLLDGLSIASCKIRHGCCLPGALIRDLDRVVVNSRRSRKMNSQKRNAESEQLYDRPVVLSYYAKYCKGTIEEVVLNVE